MKALLAMDTTTDHRCPCCLELASEAPGGLCRDCERAVAAAQPQHECLCCGALYRGQPNEFCRDCRPHIR